MPGNRTLGTRKAAEHERKTGGNSGMTDRREGMLRAEFQDWYPNVEAGRWYVADELTGLVLAHRRFGTPQWELEQRLPSDEHFDFRGGTPRGDSASKTRRGDQSWTS